MYRNLFRSEVNIDQGIKEAVNSDQFLKPWRSLMFWGVQEMPADKDLWWEVWGWSDVEEAPYENLDIYNYFE